jgi:phosphoenolpyruvate carboxylase
VGGVPTAPSRQRRLLRGKCPLQHDGNPQQERLIKNFFPCINLLNFLPVELLRRHRAGDTHERVQHGMHLTINGIAAGLRNSGESSHRNG